MNRNNHQFSRIPKMDIQRSKFDRTHGVKTAFDAGKLIPIFVDEVLPGDTFDVRANMFARMSTPVVPVLDNLYLSTQWFFIPSRLVWNNFTKMMGERVNPRDSIDFTVPTIKAPEGGWEIGSLADYFGLPTGVANIEASALPFRAYAKVWDDWYRDENLQDSIIQSTDDLGDSNGTIDWNKVLRRGKRHDYFTSCLPTPQKGDSVSLNLAGDLSLKQNDIITDNLKVGVNNNTDTVKNGALSLYSTPAQSVGYDFRLGGDSTNYNLIVDGVKVGLSEAAAITVNSLRMAFQIQRLLESDNRAGTRYIEIIRQHFRTICPDARLQRSEYLGGSEQLININAVAQTSGTTDVTPQGNLAAYASVSDRVDWVKSFTEHGYIIGLASVRADLNYQQGINRMWSRKGRYDFYWPTLAHLGEQVVLNKEIYAQGTTEDDNVFGYQERFAEYRYKPSIITGKLRSSAPQSLDVWHLAQSFDQLPTLSPEFIEDNPPIDRVLAVTDEPQFIFDGFINCYCSRPMPVYSVPGLVDHF